MSKVMQRKSPLSLFDFSSVEFPESSSTNEITAATLLQQMSNIVNSEDVRQEETNRMNFTSSPFQRTVNWTFENMKMLIGSDLPIFGDDKHPAVSLRLRYDKRNDLSLSMRILFLCQ